MGIHGVLEASEARAKSILSEGAFNDLKHNLKPQVGPDLGVGDDRQRTAIQRILDSGLEYNSVEYHQLKLELEQIENKYLSRWAIALRTKDCPVERTARNLAGFFIDSDFSGSYIADLVKECTTHPTTVYSVADILETIQAVRSRPNSVFESICCFNKLPLSRHTKSAHLMSPADAIDWLHKNCMDSSGLRIAGALKASVEARDARRAAAKAKEHFQRVISRAMVGSWIDCRPENWIAVTSLPERLELAEDRGVACYSLHRNDLIYTDGNDGSLDNAVELLGTLNSGPRGPAVTAGWTAIESLLTTSADNSMRAVAAERVGDIVACSFARAELTKLAYLYSEQHKDSVGIQIKNERSNREKARILAKHVQSGNNLNLARSIDQIAEQRIKRLIENPGRQLADISKHVSVTLRRFYLARNLIVHGGHVDSRLADSLLRAASPLIGAAFDRIIASVESERIRPIQLAARARFAIEHAPSADARHLVDLLESAK